MTKIRIRIADLPLRPRRLEPEELDRLVGGREVADDDRPEPATSHPERARSESIFDGPIE